MSKNYQPEQVELSNGIPVIFQHYEGSVAATYWWVKVGSADEGPSEAGFAHFLEHMLFKDAAAKETGRASSGKTARTIESLGGDINAYTSFDQTVYHVTCAAQHWERIIDAFGTMAKPQWFLPEDFKREREVILEELRKNEDSPGRQLFQGLFSKTFSKHPYGRPVIGYVKTLKAAKVKDLENFYRKNYVSGKMGLVLVGPLYDGEKSRKDKILPYLEKHFGAKVLRRTEPVFKKRSLEPELKPKQEWVVKQFDVKTPVLSVSFRVPELDHEDMPALDLLSSILSMGEMSRLYQKLFYKTSLATDVSGGLYVPKDPGMLYFQAEVDSTDKIETVAKELFRELKRIGTEGPTADELNRVLVNAESEKLYATQTADGLAGRLGFLKYIMGDLTFDQAYLDQLRTVDATQIQDVAKKYFDYRRLSGAILQPKTEPLFDVTPIETAALDILGASGAVNLGVAPPQPKAKTTQSPVEYIELPSGLQICFHHRPQSHVFSIHAAVLGGLRLEISCPIERADTDWGASYMMSLVWPKGTSKLKADQISSIIEGKAASLDGFAGRNSVGLQVTGLARDWESLSDLFIDVLLDATFPKEEVDHARRIAEDSVRGIEDHSSQLCSKLFLETLYETHPYGRITIGSLDSLRGIHQDKLKAFHRAWMRPDRLVLSVSGNVKRASLDRWVKSLSDRLQAFSQRVTPFNLPFSLQPEGQLKAPRWVEKPLGREQTHIMIGGLGTQITSEDRYSLRLLQTLLGGQSGRLFIELREKKSLAYTVSPIGFEGIEKGYIGTYIACSPEKKKEAVLGIQKVLETLASKGPTEQEMNRAKEFFLGRRAMDLQGDTSLAAHYGIEALYGLERMTEAELADRIYRIKGKDLQQVCRKYLVEPHMVTSIVG